MSIFDLDSFVRKVPNFPKEGVLFYDITGALVHPEAFRYIIETIDVRWKSDHIDAIVGIDARGFIFSAPLAYIRRLPLVLARKNGKLPGPTYRRSFQLEYGEDTLELHKSDIKPGMRVVIIDDIIATGGTLKVTADMLQDAGAKVVGIQGVIGLDFLPYREALRDYQVETLITYDTEHVSGT